MAVSPVGKGFDLPAVRAARAGVTGVQPIMHDGVATHRDVLGSSDPPVVLALLGLGTRRADVCIGVRRADLGARVGPKRMHS